VPGFFVACLPQLWVAYGARVLPRPSGVVLQCRQMPLTCKYHAALNALAKHLNSLKFFQFCRNVEMDFNCCAANIKTSFHIVE